MPYLQVIKNNYNYASVNFVKCEKKIKILNYFKCFVILAEKKMNSTKQIEIKIPLFMLFLT
jgi:hypothetical protein